MLHERRGFANQRIFLAGIGRVVIICVEKLKFVHTPPTPVIDLRAGAALFLFMPRRRCFRKQR